MTNQEKTQAVLEAVRSLTGSEQWSDVLVAIGKIDPKEIYFLGSDGIMSVLHVATHAVDDKWKKLLKVKPLRTPEQNMLDNPELLDFLYELLVKK